MTPVIVPGWTLNYEMMFYMLFIAILTMPIFLRLISVFVVFSFFAIFVGIFSSTSRIAAFYDPLLIFEFVVGVIVARVSERGFLAPPLWAAMMLLSAFAALLYFDVCL